MYDVLNFLIYIIYIHFLKKVEDKSNKIIHFNGNKLFYNCQLPIYSQINNLLFLLLLK